MSALVYKVTKFISWPHLSTIASRADHFDLCVVDNQHFSDSLKESVKNRKIVELSVHVENVTLESDLLHCHLLYFSKANPHLIPSFINKTEGKPILTIGTSPNFIEQGGMILFERKNNKISLLINNTKAKKEGININAHLLRLNKVRQ